MIVRPGLGLRSSITQQSLRKGALGILELEALVPLFALRKAPAHIFLLFPAFASITNVEDLINSNLSWAQCHQSQVCLALD